LARYNRHHKKSQMPVKDLNSGRRQSEATRRLAHIIEQEVPQRISDWRNRRRPDDDEPLPATPPRGPKPSPLGNRAGVGGCVLCGSHRWEAIYLPI